MKPLDQRDMDDLKETHVLDTSGHYKNGCAHCGEPWPCSTVSLVAEVEEHRKKRDNFPARLAAAVFRIDNHQ